VSRTRAAFSRDAQHRPATLLRAGQVVMDQVLFTPRFFGSAGSVFLPKCVPIHLIHTMPLSKSVATTNR
jgi:hypothetical protein